MKVQSKTVCSRTLVLATAVLVGLSIGPLASGTMAQNVSAQATTASASTPAPQVPQPAEGGVNWSGVGYGVGSAASNIVYVPAKVVYAVLGGLVGGAGYVLTAGNSQTADTIWRSSLGGDYVITPDMLAGKQQIHFSGPTTTSPGQSPVQAVTEPSSSASAPSSSAPYASNSSASPAAGNNSQPIDGGTGPVKGHGTVSSKNPVPTTSPDTSIE